MLGIGRGAAMPQQPRGQAPHPSQQQQQLPANRYVQLAQRTTVCVDNYKIYDFRRKNYYYMKELFENHSVYVTLLKLLVCSDIFG